MKQCLILENFILQASMYRTSCISANQIRFIAVHYVGAVLLCNQMHLLPVLKQGNIKGGKRMK